MIDSGVYHLMFPPEWDGATPLPALVYYHGHNSSGATVYKSGALKESFSNAGYLIIAPNGRPIGDGTRFAWPAMPPRLDWRDDVAFTLDVLDDVAARVPQVDPERIFAAGFSAGGSMAWMTGCYAGHRIAGVVSVSGALRRPAPEDVCPGGPLRLLQIHGFADKTVPLEGRVINDWHQGDVHESLSLLRRTNQCRSNPDSIDVAEPFRCRTWSKSCQTAALRLCMHDGGHGLPRGWTDLAKAWFEAE